MNNRYNDIKTINQRNQENTVHNLKTLPKYFNEVMWGNKQFETRKNDRDFKVNDIIILEEFDGDNYTDRRIAGRITFILDEAEYCKDGYITFGIRKA